MKNFALFAALTGATTLRTQPELGDIIVSNDSQNFAASLAQEVVGYLAGLPAPDESVSLERLCPLVMTADFFQFAKAGDEAFITETDGSDIRATGASFKRIETRGTIVTDATQQKGLTKRVDHRSIPMVNGSRVAGWENQVAMSLMYRLIRADKYRALAVLDGAANSTPVVWSSAGNPDGDIRAAAQRSRTASGQMPTMLVVGSAAQQLRQDVFESPDLANQALARRAEWSIQQLAQYAGVADGMIEMGLIQTKKGAAKVDQLGTAAYVYANMSAPMVDDPSMLKMAWTPTMSGGRWAVFIQEGAAWTDITVFQQTKIFAPHTKGIEKLVISES